MGFLKSLFASIKEGIDEAKAELKEEAAARAELDTELNAQYLEQLSRIPPDEKFATAIGAPYRETFLSEISAADEQNRPALYLFCMDIAEKSQDSMKNLLKRDFAVSDAASLQFMVTKTQALMYCAFSLDDANPNQEAHALLLSNALNIDDEDLWRGVLNDARKAINPEIMKTGSQHQKAMVALWVSRLAYTVTTSAGLGYIDKKEALKILDPLMHIVRKFVFNWQEFADLIKLGEKLDGTNNALGRKLIEMNLKTLLEDKKSPWVVFPWVND